MRKKTKVLSLFLALTMVFTILITPGVDKVKADSFKEVKYASSIVISKGNPSVYVDLGKKWNQNKKLTVKSSNNKVVKALDTGYPVVDLMKAGKATVTFKTGGKTYKMKFKVLAYKNPLKTFKVEDESLAGKFKKYSLSSLTYTGDTAKIKVSPNKGWKLKSIKYKAYKYDTENDSVKSYSKTVKNKTSVTFKDSSWDSHYIFVKMYNSSKHLTETIELYVDRGENEDEDF